MQFTTIKNKYNSCSKCINCLKDFKIFGNGNLTAKIAIVGEAPGKEEQEEGVPFAGAIGKLLEGILFSVPLKKQDLYFTNAILCRTGDRYRTPEQLEYKNCRERLFEELSLLKPKYTILVGSTALKAVLGEHNSIMETHGQWRTSLSSPCYWYFTIFHPLWILNSNTEAERAGKKRTMWNDIRQFWKDYQIMQNCIPG